MVKSFHLVRFLISIFLTLCGLNPAYAVEDAWRTNPVPDPFLIASIHLGKGHFEIGSETTFDLPKFNKVEAVRLNSQEIGGENLKTDPQITALRVMLPIAGALIGGLYGSADSNGSQP